MGSRPPSPTLSGEEAPTPCNRRSSSSIRRTSCHSSLTSQSAASPSCRPGTGPARRIRSEPEAAAESIQPPYLLVGRSRSTSCSAMDLNVSP